MFVRNFVEHIFRTPDAAMCIIPEHGFSSIPFCRARSAVILQNRSQCQRIYSKGRAFTLKWQFLFFFVNFKWKFKSGVHRRRRVQIKRSQKICRLLAQFPSSFIQCTNKTSSSAQFPCVTTIVWFILRRTIFCVRAAIVAIVSGNVSASVEAQLGTVVVSILSFSRCGNRIYVYVITLNLLVCLLNRVRVNKNQLQRRPDDGGFFSWRNVSFPENKKKPVIWHLPGKSRLASKEFQTKQKVRMDTLHAMVFFDQRYGCVRLRLQMIFYKKWFEVEGKRREWKASDEWNRNKRSIKTILRWLVFNGFYTIQELYWRAALRTIWIFNWKKRCLIQSIDTF